MMTINIIAIGKIKESYLVKGIGEYLKRLSRFAKISIVELGDEAIPDNAGLKQEKEVLIKEGKRILSILRDESYVITLCIEGKILDSVELAERLGKLAIDGKSNITFIIGGSLGLSDEVKARANFSLSFSKMTFPHQLMRIMLLEQVYRAFKINANETYHK